jgi:sodium-dependent dicarboxylate transporter 2/3/5
LFIGGFMLAAALQRWQVDRRIAWSLLSVIGTRQDRLIAGVMAATAFISLWVSNTATAAMMLPIALALIAATDSSDTDFAQALLLAVAYSASLGGIGTLIGSPPNGIAARFIEQTYGREFSFADWVQFALPVMLVMLPLTWLLLTRVLFRVGSREATQAGTLAARELTALGPLTRGARLTLAVFAVTVLLWITRPLLAPLQLGAFAPFSGLTDAWIAVLAAVALLALPAGGRARVLGWRDAARQPWRVLILFGGGLALAAAIEANGVAAFIAGGAAHLAGWPAWAILLMVVAATVFLSELTSNTAQVATMVPILAAAAPGLGIDPLLLILPCAMAASCAFMMPVGTPPNAIVFGSGLITLRRMCRTGVWLNFVAIAVITVLSLLLAPAR